MILNLTQNTDPDSDVSTDDELSNDIRDELAELYDCTPTEEIKERILELQSELERIEG